MMFETNIHSPVGELRLVASDDALVGVFLEDHTPAPSLVARRVDAHPILNVAARQIAEYFAGARRAFDLPLDPQGFRAFDAGCCAPARMKGSRRGASQVAPRQSSRKRTRPRDPTHP